MRQLPSHSKDRLPVRSYARRVGSIILKYSIRYPIAHLRNMSPASRRNGRIRRVINLESDPHHAICGTERMASGQRQLAESLSRRVEGNVPRPLYRHWIEVPNSDPPERCLQIDQRGLKQRRRLSFDGEQKRSSGFPRNVVESPQKRCYILDLPAEIRCLIWEYAVGNRTIHIFYNNPVKPWEEGDNTLPKLRCVECNYRPSPNGWENLEPMNPTCPDCGVIWDSCAECRGKVDWRNTLSPDWNILPPPGQWGTCSMVDIKREWQPLDLLATCRQIYTEGIHVLYSTNTFCFPLPAPWRGTPHAQPKPIEDFSSSILPQRLKQITRVSVGIYFPQFKSLNNVLAQNLPGLRYVELRARIPRRDYETNMDPDTGALSQLVSGVRGRVAGAKVVLRADLDDSVPPRLGTQLPEGLEVVMTPDEAWERSGFPFWRF
ncbi:hypothetical protein F5B22DRAFT_624441 [Xylaria bambusicola]|uniref:uncharacterized protein n=1 Tax=Xylaria bambusicola TaxID=326684 RepID=UPI002007A283|nr:uncharacterized protein F5B22DRAFT_624441 [Xylaria bambusicola]KAI0506325.1 hypothetical protein F5B22DRAFT_624441 [Xylaria bambusicola]